MRRLGKGLALLAAVALAAAIVFPIFARARSTTGKSNYPLIVAKAIQAFQLVRRKPPETADEVRPYLPSYLAKRLEFSIRPIPPENGGTLYEITTQGRNGRWRVPWIDPPEPRYVP